MLYAIECWAVKNQLEKKRSLALMRMLRWMCGKTREDRIRNDNIRVNVGVVSMVENMVETSLRWFRHVLEVEEDIRKL
jgi:hypothetical protein